MTPAEKAGLKVGDKIRIISVTNRNLQKGEIITFVEDDGSRNPWFSTERDNDFDKNAYDIINDEWEKVEENNMNKEFKAMKFWVGTDKELSTKVQKVLLTLGYSWSAYGDTLKFIENSVYYVVDTSGTLSRGIEGLDSYGDFGIEEGDIPNIEWLKAPKRAIVKIGDKSYYEEELADALSGINEVNV